MGGSRGGEGEVKSLELWGNQIVRLVRKGWEGGRDTS